MPNCKGVCENINGAVRKAKYVKDGRRYAYCSICCVSFPLEEIQTVDAMGRAVCPCCGNVLRLIPRKPQTKTRFLTMFEPTQAMLYAR